MVAAVFKIADAHNAHGDNRNRDPCGKGNGFLQNNYAKKRAQRAGRVSDGIGDGFFDKAHAEEGKRHRKNVTRGHGQVRDQVHGIVGKVLSQQGIHRRKP